MGRGDESSCAHATGDVELGGGDGGIRGASNDGGGVVEAEEEQLSWAEDGDDVTTGLTLWLIMSTPSPLLELLVLPLEWLLVLLVLL